MTIVIRFKSGFELRVKCREYKQERDQHGRLVDLKLTGVRENKPVYFNLDDVELVYRVLSDEGDDSA